MVRVFFSFSNDDYDRTHEVRGWLQSEGHQVFLSRDLDHGMRVGEEWKERLYEELRGSDALVCLITANYAESAWCAAELGISDSNGMKIFPVRADAGVDHPLVTTLHYADLAADPDRARSELLDALRRLETNGKTWSSAGSPYPGLRPFTAGMSPLFFGRAAEIRRLAERLRTPAGSGNENLLVVVGPSGCGKSSFVRAGLHPAVEADRDWLVLPPLVPGSDPVAALAQALLSASRRLDPGWSLSDIEAGLGEPGGLDRIAVQLTAAASAQRLLLVVDQAEELVTRSDPAAREQFTALIRGRAGGPVRTVATLRSDYLDPILELAAQTGVALTAFPLAPLSRDMLSLVVTGPARLAGIAVEDELVARLVSDTGDGRALPLLAFVLEQLSIGVHRGGRLSVERYEALGGVQGALTGHADVALATACSATGRTEPEVLADLLHLVAIDGDGNVVRRNLDTSVVPVSTQTALDKFVDARLLTVDTDGGRRVISVAHDKVLTAWKPFARAINAAIDELRLRRAVEDAAADWDRSGRPPDHLWDRGRVSSTVRALDPSSLTVTAASFLDAGRRLGERRRLRATAVLSVLLLLVSTGAGLAVSQWRSAVSLKEVADDARRAAAVSGLVARAEVLRATDPRQALRLGAAAERIASNAQTLASLLETIAGVPNLETTLAGHQGGVTTAAFSPDGRTLASGSADGTVLLWDLTDPATPRQLGEPFRRNSGEVWSIAFSPGGTVLASGGADGAVALWDLADPAAPRQLGEPLHAHTAGVRSVAFSPDGRTLATGSADNTVARWDLTDPTAPRQLGEPVIRHAAQVWSVAFSPDGRTLATGSADNTVARWDLTDPTAPRQLGEPLHGHTGEVWSIAFSPDGTVLASGGADGTVALWDVSDRDSARRMAEPLVGGTPLNALAFSRNGTRLAAGTASDTVILWDVTEPAAPMRLPDTFRGHTGQVKALAFTPDGTRLATGSDDSTVILWDLTGRYAPSQLGEPMRGHTDQVNAVDYAPDGRTLVTVGDDDRAVLWDVTDPARPRQYPTPLLGHTKPIGSVAFGPDGHLLATGSPDRTAILWDVTDPTAPRQYGAPLTGHTSWIWCLAISPDGRTLATGSADATVILWDVTDPTDPRPLGEPLGGHTAEVGSVAFTPDSRTLAVGSVDTTVILWDVTDPADPRPLSEPLRGHTGAVDSVVFSADGRLMASGSGDTTAILWDVTDRHDPRRLGDALPARTGGVASVTFAPDSQTLATGVTDHTTVLWDLTDLNAPRRLGEPLRGHTDEVWSVSFSPDGQTLATGSSDSTAILWDVRSLRELRADPVRRACMQAGGLSPQEWDRFVPGLPYADACTP